MGDYRQTGRQALVGGGDDQVGGWFRDIGSRHERPGRTVGFLRDRSVLALGVVTIAGVTLVAAGWCIQGRAYVPGLLMQLGTSLMLLVPLALLGFMLEDRIRRTEEKVRAAAEQLDALTAITRERLSEHRRQREDLLRGAQREPTQAAIRGLLSDALEIGAVATSGGRVMIPGSSLRLRFRSDDADIVARTEEMDGTVLEELRWRAGESAGTFAERLAVRLTAMSQYPRDRSFDPTTVFQQLLKLLEVGVESRTGERPYDLGPLIEIPNEQWAISSEGLFSLQRPYHISAERIINSHEDWPRYMRSQSWVDMQAFDQAYSLARKLLPSSGAAGPL